MRRGERNRERQRYSKRKNKRKRVRGEINLGLTSAINRNKQRGGLGLSL